MQNHTQQLFPNLIAAMSRAGLQRRQLAGILGISLSTVNRRLGGSVQFRWNELRELHRLFPDIPMKVLLERRTSD